MVDVQSVGAGGGSIASVRQGALLVGPESAGAQPGPACYGRGGIRATVTDADALLGYLPVEGFAGGRMTLDVEASRAAITRDIGEPLGLDVIGAAWGIERIVNANMANAVRRVLSTHGADPRTLAMIAYGGNGAVHAWAQAVELGIRRILVPKSAPAFSALGLLVADYLIDLQRAYVVPLSQVDVARVRTLMSEMLDEADKELEPANLGEGHVQTQLFAQMCYPGQNFDMSVPVPEGTSLGDSGLLDLAGRFHDQHASDRGFSFPNQQPLLRGVRLIASGGTPKPDALARTGAVVDASQARKGSRAVYFGTEFVDSPVYDGAALGPRRDRRGPGDRRGALHRRRPRPRQRRPPRPPRQLRHRSLKRPAAGCSPLPLDVGELLGQLAVAHPEDVDAAQMALLAVLLPGVEPAHDATVARRELLLRREVRGGGGGEEALPYRAHGRLAVEVVAVGW